MFKDLKEKIKDLAVVAVNYAEDKLNSASGKEKKKAAVLFIVDKLGFHPVLKPVMMLFFTKFIDNAIEKAVDYMKRIRNED